jgi:hypothetical protein
MEGKDSASALSMRDDNPESMARSVFNDYICFNVSSPTCKPTSTFLQAHHTAAKCNHVRHRAHCAGTEA